MENLHKQAPLAQEARLKGTGWFKPLASLLTLSSAAAAASVAGPYDRPEPCGAPQAQPAPVRRAAEGAYLRPLADLPPMNFPDPLHAVRLRPVPSQNPRQYMRVLSDLPPLRSPYDAYAAYVRRPETQAAMPAPVKMEAPYWAEVPVPASEAPVPSEAGTGFSSEVPGWVEEPFAAPVPIYPPETVEAETTPPEERAPAQPEPEAETTEAETASPEERTPAQPEPEALPETAEAEATPPEEAPAQPEPQAPPEAEAAEAEATPPEETPAQPEPSMSPEAEATEAEAAPPAGAPAQPEPETETAETEGSLPMEAVSAAVATPEAEWPSEAETEPAEAAGPATETPAAGPEASAAFGAETEEPKQTFILDEILSTAREAPETEPAEESAASASVQEESFVTDETLSSSGKVSESMPLVADYSGGATVVSGPPAADVAQEEDEEDDLDAGDAHFGATARESLPEPVPVSGETSPLRPNKRRRFIKWFFGVVLLAAVGVALYQSGLWAQFMAQLIPETTQVTITVSPLPSISELNLGTANNTPAATATPVINTELRSVTVEPSVTTAPATLNFTLVTNAATTSVRLMTEDGQMLHTTANSAPQDDGLVWQIATEISEPYSGSIHIFLRDQDGVWSVGSIPCTVTVE